MGIGEDMKRLGEDIVASYDARAKTIGTLVKDTHRMLKGFRTEHKEMSAGQAEGLAAFVEDLTKDVGNMRKTLQQEHEAMADGLKKELAKYVVGIVSEAKKLLGGFADERENMADSWQALTATMAKKRGGKPVNPFVSANIKVKTAEEAVAKAAKGKGKKKGMKKNEVVW